MQKRVKITMLDINREKKRVRAKKALTAYKPQLPDLIMESNTFEPSRYLIFRFILPYLA